MPSLVDRLRSVGRAEHTWHIVRNAALGLGVAMCVVVLAAAIEAIAHGSTTFRTVVYWSALGLSASALIVLLAPRIKQWLTPIDSHGVNSLARRVGVAYPDVRDTLANAIQLDAELQQSTSPDLTKAAIQQASRQAEDKDFGVIIERKPIRTALLWLAGVGGVSLLLFVMLPGVLGSSVDRLMRHDISFVPPAPFTLHVHATPDSVMRGGDAAVQVRAKGTPPKEVTLWIKEGSDERFSSFNVKLDSASSYKHQLPGLTSSAQFFAESQWMGESVLSDTQFITVIDKPIVRSLNGRVIPPSYTHLPPTELDERQADVTALVGSSVDVNVVSSKALSQAELVVVRGTDSARLDTHVVRMSVNDHNASARFSVAANGSYYVRLRDKEGQTNAEPTQYGIIALTDGHPTISMVEPTKDVDVDASSKLALTVAIADDYGFSGLRLKYRLIASKYAPPEEKYSEVQIPFSGASTAMDVGYVWNLSKIGITPEDVYEFYVEVADNDVISGPKTARTSVLKLRLPSLDEVFAEADHTQQELQKELKEITKESEQIRKEAEELRREMQKQQSQAQRQTEWADKKKAEDLAKRQEELQNRMEKMADKLEDMANKLEQNKTLSPETLKKYMELQQLMRDVKSPELERMQQQMKKAMEQMSPEEMEKMMKQFTFDEEQFKKNIERTISLLKRTQAEQKAEELAKRAEELARKQDELRKQAENTNANDQQKRDQLAKQQDALQKEFKQMADEAKELEKLMKEIGADMPMDQLDAAKRELAEQETTKSMQDAEKQMQQGDMEQASQNQNTASQNMQRFAQQMNQLKKQMKRNAQRETAKQMQKGMNDLLDLSKEQEALMQSMKQMDPSSSQYSQAAKKQQQMHESMQNLANSMMQLSQKSTAVTPEMASDLGDAMQSMKDAMGQMQERNGPMASREQGNAMSSMNSAVGRMSDALGKMMQGEGQGQGGEGQNPGEGKGQGTSPFQRLQSLAEQQQNINQGMQNVGQNGQPLSQEQRAEIGRLGQQQGRALKALEELERERRNVGGEKKTIGDLNQIADDMKEVMTDMQTGSITPETRMRQDRILSRLLNASRSMNERDYEKSRESRSGTDVGRKSPGELNFDADTQRTTKEMLDELRKGYTKDYENLIRRYFEAVQRKRIESQENR